MGLRTLAAGSGQRQSRLGVIRYLVDSSALWRLLRDASLREGWAEVVTAGAVGSCVAQRTEFRRSTRDVTEHEQMTEMFEDLYPAVLEPKQVWRWVESAQRRLARTGSSRALSTVDLLIRGTAVHHRLTVLHDDNDFRTAAEHLPDLAQRRIHQLPT